METNRRQFLKAVSAGAAWAAAPGVSANALEADEAGASALRGGVVTNRVPLAPNKYYLLPLTAVRPQGWLRRQLEIQAAGMSGHLDEFWPDVGPDSGWLGGNGEAWERGPYFVDGLVPLAYLLQDQRLIAKAKKYVEWSLSNQQANGMFGPAKNDDWWPRMVMLKALTQYQEATGDPRVIPCMTKYFEYQQKQLAGRPLHEWGKYRWQDEVISVLWLFNRTGNRRLLELARLLHEQGHDWSAEFSDFKYKDKQTAAILNVKEGTPLRDQAMQTHGVNIAMGLKTSAVWSLLSKTSEDREGVRRQLDVLERYHGIPNGMFSADEHLAGRDPSQGVELCAVVEQMFSLEHSLAILGDPLLGDLLEKLAYNALPGTFTDDMWAHQYDQQPNQIQCSLRARPWSTNGPEANLYGLEPNFGCCTANYHQGWPKLVSSLWMADGEGGLVAAAYAPCEVHTTVGKGKGVVLREETQYPFREDITLTVTPDEPIAFRLHLRIPAWAEGASVRVNGKALPSPKPGSFAVLEQTWHAGDKVELRFPMKPRLSRWYNQSVAVERGPVVFSLNVEEDWQKLRDRGMTADWAVNPKSPWNYGIVASESSNALRVEEREATGDLFSAKHAPVVIHAKARRLPDWKEQDGVAAPVPQSPVHSSGEIETVELIPYAAAKLRITAFPQVEDGPAAKSS